jgi:hypothetical protein
MIRSWLAAATIMATTSAPAFAQLQPPGGAPGFQSPAMPAPIQPPSSVGTSRGAGLVTGTAGSPQTVMIPGSPVPGMLLNNGNGTSTIMIPGSTSEVVPTPR